MAKQPQQRPSETGLRENSSRSQRANWSTADLEQLKSTVAAVTEANGAIRFGISRDGGAFAIGIYGDGDPYTLHRPHDYDINILLAQIETAFRSLTG